MNAIWDLMDDKSTLVQVMAWCRQATSHYLSQCWPTSIFVVIWFHQPTMSSFLEDRIKILYFLSFHNTWHRCLKFDNLENKDQFLRLSIPWLLIKKLNSFAPGRFQFHFRKVIFKLILVNGGWGISYEIALRWKQLDFTDDKSTLVQVMAWCCQATSHYLSQCWPRSMSPNGVTRPQWVNSRSLILLWAQYMWKRSLFPIHLIHM